jgi:hypothetical protein
MGVSSESSSFFLFLRLRASRTAKIRRTMNTTIPTTIPTMAPVEIEDPDETLEGGVMVTMFVLPRGSAGWTA